MPSPFGHALAGLAVGLLADGPSTAAPDDVPGTALPGTASSSSRAWGDWALAGSCAGLAVLPDLDLVLGPAHRTATHSVTAVALVIIMAIGVTGWVTGRPAWRTALVCGSAYGSHLLLDWLGRDPRPPYGIQAFWPMSREWFIAPWTIFPGTERRAIFSAHALATNLKAGLVEGALLGPLAWASGVRRRRRSRGRTSGPAAPPRPFA